MLRICSLTRNSFDAIKSLNLVDMLNKEMAKLSGFMLLQLVTHVKRICAHGVNKSATSTDVGFASSPNVVCDEIQVTFYLFK